MPHDGQLIFFGDKAQEAAYAAALERWRSLGATLVSFDLEPFYETARLLYEGPWVAERYLVIRNLLASSPDAIHPVTREITIAGSRISAADTFAALYRLQTLRRTAEHAFSGVDALVLPTAPTAYSTAQVLANPIELNSRLGTYTNFVNLLDLCGLALPSAIRPDEIPFGITLLAPAGQDALLASIGRVFQAQTKLTLGAKGVALPPLADIDLALTDDEIPIAVVGAHLSGMALNGELKELDGRLIEATSTAPDYRLYALSTTPPKPGMLRVEAGAGTSIELEVWALPAVAFAKFVAAIPSPLSIGTVRLKDGRGVKGFIVEAADIAGARIFPPLAAGALSWRRRRRPLKSLYRNGVNLVFAVHPLDMRAHRVCRAVAVATQNSHHHAVMLGMRLGEPSEIAELGAPERLHALARRQRDLGDMAVLRAGIDRKHETAR